MSARLRLLPALCLALALTTGAGAAPAATTATSLPQANSTDLAGLARPKGEEPIDLSADELHVDEANRTVTFTGHVVARQGNVQLMADNVIAHYLAARQSGSSSTGRIELLEATGNVVVTRPGEVVKGATATYKMIDKRILMHGNVVATRGQNVVSGESLIVDLVKETVSLSAGSSDGRVHAIFAPPTSKDTQ